ncbi:glucose 1-dehydrogenase [Streptosporangium sp. NBC_01755]|uniref:SDR family NAD(P)-dependent oxidoreductase n=1 Tax=Streptosporangium sp. NBC_01755 TaxID=2975949 RepID=UPI002DD8D63A|nr:glucose 1-dehydrogenase [Streptosporangium sp. NBC_01755]WSD01122.1 glucose 1-dehydrogenase [Streptosporangium sp. NBC_01755]
MSYDFHGMTFVITGSTRGIGASTARAAASHGANVVISGTSEPAGKSVEGEIVKAGGQAIFVACDLRDEEQVRMLMSRAVEVYGGIDVLHNNAGINETALSSAVSLEDMTVETFDHVLDVNVRGAWLCAKYALPHLKSSRRQPSIINTGSTGSFAAFPGCIAYGVSKGGLSLLTKNLALDLAKYGIRVNGIAPGVTETEMVADYVNAAADPEARKRAMSGMHLVPRLGRPEEIAELVCFLASDKALFVNGVEWLIDGGTLAWRGNSA